MIQVEVAYANDSRQSILNITLPTPSDIHTVITQSGILSLFPEIDLARANVGIWGEIKPLHHFVIDGDRIEIYHPLRQDPKAARRLRVHRQQ